MVEYLTSDGHVVLDRVLPDLDGIELCRRIRAKTPGRYTYVILVTMIAGKEPYMQGMDAEADDYFSKPVDADELRSRLRVTERVLALQEELAFFRGLLSIRAYCENIRDDAGEWVPVEKFLRLRAPVSFSHGVCPHCYSERVMPELKRLRVGPVPG